MLLNLTVRVATGTDPGSQTVLDLLADAAAREASVWTEPVLTCTDPLSDGTTILHFQVDAVPRGHVTTTRSVTPTLLPPHR